MLFLIWRSQKQPLILERIFKIFGWWICFSFFIEQDYRFSTFIDFIF